MANKYVELNRAGTGYAGTDVDPYSWADVLANLSASNTYFMRGQASLTTDFASSLAFTFKAWNIAEYGPWRLYGGSTYYFYASASSMENGIIDANVIFVKHVTKIFLYSHGQTKLCVGGSALKSTFACGANIVIEEDADITATRCVFDPDLQIKVLEDASLIVVQGVTDKADYAALIDLGSGATVTLDIQYAYVFLPASYPEWYDANIELFSVAAGYGIGSRNGWAEENTVALFSMSDRRGRAPFTVQFTDESTGNPTSWLWDFGNGTTSTPQNPSHTYTEDGEYTVTLVTDWFEETVPSWASGYFSADEFAGGAFDSEWWNQLWKDDVSFYLAGTEYIAISGTVASPIQLTPPNIFLSKDDKFTLHWRINFGANTAGGDHSDQMEIVDSATDTALVRLEWTDTGSAPGDVILTHLVNGGSGTGPVDTDSIAGKPSVNGSVEFKLVCSAGAAPGSRQLTAHYSVDAGANWIDMTGPWVNAAYASFYLQFKGATYHGIEFLRFYSDADGFEKHYIQRSASTEVKFAQVSTPIIQTLVGLGRLETRKSYHFGSPANPMQGIGWSENMDGDWIWPDSLASLVGLNDSNGYRLALCNCSNDGLFYIFNTRDGSDEGKLIKRFVDKYDPNRLSSGTEIPCVIKFGEHFGSSRHLTISNKEYHAHLRPEKAENRGASGYDAYGQRSGQTLRLNLYKNGESERSATEVVLPLGRELMFVRRIAGTSLQTELITLTSEFKLGRFEAYYSVYDRARHPAAASNDINEQSTVSDLNLSETSFWVSRGAQVERERVSHVPVGSVQSLVVGPDGKTDSGVVFEA
jgi:hypothetical protein